jgi:ribosomal protein L7Ae-like RNA K-turn-binding protein
MMNDTTNEINELFELSKRQKENLYSYIKDNISKLVVKKGSNEVKKLLSKEDRSVALCIICKTAMPQNLIEEIYELAKKMNVPIYVTESKQFIASLLDKTFSSIAGVILTLDREKHSYFLKFKLN